MFDFSTFRVRYILLYFLQAFHDRLTEKRLLLLILLPILETIELCNPTVSSSSFVFFLHSIDIN